MTTRWPRRRCCISPAAAWILRRHCPEALRTRLGTETVRLADSLGRLGEFNLDEHWSAGQSLAAGQAETLRKMLLAVVGDPRLVLARLAEQTVRARHAREAARQRPRPHRAGDPGAVCAAGQSPGHLVAEVGTGGPGLPRTAAGRIPADRAGPQREDGATASSTSAMCSQTLAARLQLAGISGRRAGATEAHLQHLPENAAQAAGLRAGVRRTRRARHRAYRGRLLCGTGRRA